MVTATRSPEFSLGEKQREMFWDDRRFLVYVGGRGTGKSTAACMRLLGMVQRDEIKPGARLLIVAPDYTQLMDGTIKTFDYWFDAAGLIRHKVNGNKPLRILEGEIEVLCRSAMNLDQTRSKECNPVWLDEFAQMDESIFTLTNANVRQTGIRDPDTIYQSIITTTPRGMNHLYRRFVNPATAFADDRMGYYHMTTVEAEDEGIARPGYVEELGYDPGSIMYRQEVLAEFVAWSGLVFRQGWNKLSIKPKLRYVVGGVDTGTISPSAIVLVGVDEPGNVYVFKQFYEARAELHTLARIIGEWHQEYGVNRWVIDDADLWRMLRNAGLPAQPPNKKQDAADAMVNYINSLISRGMFHIDEHECHDLVKEMNTYEYKDKTSGDEVTFLDKVKPNQADHAIDALRYAVRVLSGWRTAQMPLYVPYKIEA